MFSTRTAWDRALNPLARAVAAARARGGVLDLTETNPTAVGLSAPRSLLDLLADPAAASYAPEAAGWRPARAAVAADYARRGARLSADEVLLTASTSEAYAHAVQAPLRSRRRRARPAAQLSAVPVPGRPGVDRSCAPYPRRLRRPLAPRPVRVAAALARGRAPSLS